MLTLPPNSRPPAVPPPQNIVLLQMTYDGNGQDSCNHFLTFEKNTLRL